MEKKWSFFSLCSDSFWQVGVLSQDIKAQDEANYTGAIPYRKFCLKLLVSPERNVFCFDPSQVGLIWYVIHKPIMSTIVLAPGGGDNQGSFIQEGSAPRSNPLPFYIPFLIEKVPLSYTFYWQMYLFHNASLELCIPFNCCKCIVLFLNMNIVIRGDWLRKAANVKKV